MRHWLLLLLAALLCALAAAGVVKESIPMRPGPIDPPAPDLIDEPETDWIEWSRAALASLDPTSPAVRIGASIAAALVVVRLAICVCAPRKQRQQTLSRPVAREF